MKRSFLIVFALWLCTSLIAHNFSFIPLPTQLLLPVANVHCVMQDAEGYMWYATQGGLCRDNGYQIDVFRPALTDSSETSYAVNCMVEGANGSIYFGTPDGLFCLNKKDYNVCRIELDSANHFITALYVDSKLHIWVGTKGVIFECDDKGALLSKYSSCLDGTPMSVSSISETDNGTLYVLLWRAGILRKQRGESQFTSLKWPIPTSPLQMIEDRSNQCYWVSTSSMGIQRMTIKGDSCILTAQPSTLGDSHRNRVLYMLYDMRHGLFWTTTHDNLYAYRLDEDKMLREYPLTSWSVKEKKILDQMCVDANGNIYVAGYTPHTFIISSPMSDINRMPIDVIRQQTSYSLLADRAVYDGDRLIWIWQGRQGLMLYDKEKDCVIQVPFTCERNLQSSSMGGVWVSSENVVSRLWYEDNQIRSERVLQVLEGTHVNCLTEKDGELLYVVADSTIYSFSLSGRQLVKIATLPDEPRDIAIDHSGTIYLPLGNVGLYRVTRDGDVQRIDKVKQTYLSVCVSADGTVWTSTNEGNVYCYSPSDERFTKEVLLCSANNAAIRNIRLDGLGHLWTLTDQEVCEYSPLTQAFRVFKNTDRSVNVNYFYTIEQINQSKICVAAAGALIEIQSSAQLNTQSSALVHPILSSVTINGEKKMVVNQTEKISLKPNEEDIILRLSTLDHLHASSISFAYQLNSVQDEWIYLPQGINTIELNNLPSGSHQLFVKATDKYGLWGQVSHIVTIHRAAYWWKTWWAYLLYICIVIGSCYGVWRLEHRIHILRRLIRRREEVRLNEIELKRDDIGEYQFGDEFLRKTIDIIEKNISCQNYNVETLADDMCMSRITFYRHLHSMTGQTPSEFIRDIRLKKAASLLLQHPNVAISDVAHKVGFATPKYFSRCFKEKFGVLPKDYRTKQVSE